MMARERDIPENLLEPGFIDMATLDPQEAERLGVWEDLEDEG